MSQKYLVEFSIPDKPNIKKKILECLFLTYSPWKNVSMLQGKNVYIFQNKYTSMWKTKITQSYTHPFF